MTSLPSEATEWLDELVTGWVEVHKKSMTTVVLLRIVAEHAPVPAATIGTQYTRRTGWTLNERGLYRTLKRLTGSGLLDLEQVRVARTGLPRHDYRLTDLGERYLERLEGVLDSVG